MQILDDDVACMSKWYMAIYPLPTHHGPTTPLTPIELLLVLFG